MAFFEQIAVVKNPLGMDSTAAAKVVAAAKLFELVDITATYSGKTVSAKSVLKVMTLALVFGSEVTISANAATSEQAEQAVKRVVLTIEQGT